ncbi:hypothetical protein VQ056_01810 [Paenibacillus sp. JTLBN-2024]
MLPLLFSGAAVTGVLVCSPDWAAVSGVNRFIRSDVNISAEMTTTPARNEINTVLTEVFCCGFWLNCQLPPPLPFRRDCRSRPMSGMHLLSGAAGPDSEA